ncbi:hypothetical protein COOONC_24183, partial [Cooperia oncophora]
HTNGKHTPSFTHAREQAKGYFDSKKFPEAIEIYSRALSLSPGNYDRSILLANRGMGYLCLFKKRFPNDRSIVRLSDQISVAMDSAHAHQSHVMCDDSNFLLIIVERFCGQTNTHTDIKEANFFGSRNQYVVAGSDCGSLLLWERSSGVLVAAWNADQSILNIVQPHPTQFMLATSGIEEVIRLWQPMEEGKEVSQIGSLFCLIL